jgi:hypothetical protein
MAVNAFVRTLVPFYPSFFHKVAGFAEARVIFNIMEGAYR